MYEFHFEYIYSTFYPLFLNPSIRPAIYLSIYFFFSDVFFYPPIFYPSIFLSTLHCTVFFSIYQSMYCFCMRVCMCAEVVRSKLLFFSVLWHPFVTYRIYSVYQPASPSLIFFQGPYITSWRCFGVTYHSSCLSCPPCPFVYFIFFGPFNKVENPIYISIVCISQRFVSTLFIT